MNFTQIAADALAKCAGYDPWFPKPAQATVNAWAEQIAIYKLDRADVLAGVAMMYRDNGAGFKPLPKDMIQAAREIRRQRAEVEKGQEVVQDAANYRLESSRRAQITTFADDFGEVQS